MNYGQEESQLEDDRDKPSTSQIICDICNKKFASSRSLHRHKLNHEKNKSKQIFQCTICG